MKTYEHYPYATKITNDNKTCKKFIKNLYYENIPLSDILSCNITNDLLVEWIHDFDFTLPRSIKMNYKVRGKQYSVKHKGLGSSDAKVSKNTPLSKLTLTQQYNQI